MKIININQEPVQLYKILKFEGLVESGAAAKIVISDGLVLVNDTLETRKRRKIITGDIISFNGEKMCVKLS